MEKNIVRDVFLSLGTVCFFLFYSSLSHATFNKNDIGVYGAQFLKIPVGAKAIGMGQAQTAIVQDANAIYYNPAGLAQSDQKCGEYMFAQYAGDTSYHWIAVTLPVKRKIHSLGIAIQYLNLGNIDETTVQGNKIGTFNPSDLAVNFSLAQKFLEIPFGINFKFIQTKIKETATAVAVDVGAQYRSKNEKFYFGFSSQNLGSTFQFENEKTKLPIVLRVGSGYQIKKHWLVAADGFFPEDNFPQFAMGTDYQYKILKEMFLSGRIGYHSQGRKEEGWSGIAAGLGFQFTALHLDYAWMPLGNLGEAHRVSLGARY